LLSFGSFPKFGAAFGVFFTLGVDFLDDVVPILDKLSRDTFTILQLEDDVREGMRKTTEETVFFVSQNIRI
jgi:hypothetical protein